ncbi:MAG: hypothetical protein MJA32_00360 [Proteobacteria bacterium]|nr:hypothetical protein [Pseudomonadota bacterium]
MDFRRREPLSEAPGVTTSVRALAGVCVALLGLWTSAATAEPYLAVAEGLHCSACHSHPGGGGKRNVYGNAYAQGELPATRIGNTDAPLWTGELNRRFSIGGNLRAGYRFEDIPDRSASSGFDVNKATVYLEATLIPGRLGVYVDQQVAPSASINREAYVRLTSAGGRWSLTGGQFFLPYGLRLQDDTAFVRLATGTNFTNPDRGMQLGYESGPWSAIASVTNGSGGGGETDKGKQFSLISAFVRPRWRVGLSASVNDGDGGDREMAGLFAGLRTGPIAWLAEVDLVADDAGPGGTRGARAGLVEANWMPRRGHNVKFSYDVLDPDDDVSEDHEVRYSLQWEYSPVQFLQGRLGVRVYDGPPGDARANRDALFAELHGYF